jgi:putative DNA primase/helicase
MAKLEVIDADQDGGVAIEAEALAPEFSDEWLALRFANDYGVTARYVDAWGKWYIWDGKRWAVDDTRQAFDLSRKICRAAAAEHGDTSNNAKASKQIASAKTVYAVVNLARADRRLAATVDQWDADPWLLGTPTGTVDLRTGKLRPRSPGDYITKLTGVSPDPSCPITRWREVLDRATGADHELIDYLQRMFGYALTGSTREHTLHFAHGTGANSKTTLLKVVTGCMGDYHRTAPIETFTITSLDRHPTDLAMLRGSRLVTATETEEGRKWAESRIKQLTGGDSVSARFMRQDFFEYVPQFTLVIVGNHKPSLRTVDEAIRRRYHLIPFNVTIPPQERDPDLGEKLKAEWPGILHWCIEGCLAWQRVGLSAPKAVIDATAAYLEAEDAMAAWLEEECIRDPNAWTRTHALFASWRSWAEKCAEPYGSTKSFRDRMEARGIFAKAEPGTKRAGYQGVKLKPQETDTSEAYWNTGN